MPARFGGEVMYFWLAITNLLKATAISQGKNPLVSVKRLRRKIRGTIWLRRNFLRRRRQHRHVLFALQYLRRGDVSRRSNKRSGQRKKLRRRFREGQNA